MSDTPPAELSTVTSPTVLLFKTTAFPNGFPEESSFLSTVYPPATVTLPDLVGFSSVPNDLTAFESSSVLATSSWLSPLAAPTSISSQIEISSSSAPVNFGSGPPATGASSSPTAATSTPSASPSHHGISKGALAAAIVVPVVALLILLVAIGLFIRRRKQRRQVEKAKALQMRQVSPQETLPPMGARSTSGLLHSIPRKAATVSSINYSGLSLPEHNDYQLPINGMDEPRSTHQPGSGQPSPHALTPPSRPLTALLPDSPEPGEDPDDPRLTEANLMSHSHDQGSRSQSPFNDHGDDNISDISSSGVRAKGHDRELDEVSIVSSLAEDGLEDMQRPRSAKDV